MRGRQQRHPVLESAVFAAALLLSAFVARELWRRRPVTPDRAVGEAVPLAESVGKAVESNPYRPPLPAAASTHRTERAVTGGVPAIKLTRVQGRKHTFDAVPVPK